MNAKKRVRGSWVDAPDCIHKINTSTDIITTLPANIIADGTNATVGLMGNMSQSGTPTPTTPIQPQECGERTGNLVFVSVDNETHFSNYNQYTISDGTITVTGRMLIGFKVKITPDTTYTVSAVYRAGVLMRVRQYTEIPNDWVNGFINQPVNTNLASATFTTSSEAEWILVTFYSEVVGGTINSIMLNLGSTPLPYEKYGYKIPISSAEQTTPVYLGEVQSTRRIKKLVLTGEENWGKKGNLNYTFEYNPSSRIINGLCSHYAKYYTQNLDKIDGIYLSNTNAFIITDLRFTTLTDFKAYLAQQYANGTPVTVWYVLAEPETAVVNEPLRKIGDYADEVSGISIPTIAGANTLSVDTTLQPSEVTVNYKGWHPLVGHKRINGAWT